MANELSDLLEEIRIDCDKTGQSKTIAFHTYVKARDEAMSRNDTRGVKDTNVNLGLMRHAHDYGLRCMRDYIWFEE